MMNSGIVATFVAGVGAVVCLVVKRPIWFWPLVLVALWFALFSLGRSWQAAGMRQGG